MPTTQGRVSFQRKKYLETRIHAFIKGGREDFGTWAKYNRGATQKQIEARMEKSRPGRYAMLEKLERTRNLSSKTVHAHHPHER